MAQKGWVVLFRKILEWEWYQDTHTLHLFVHLLLKVNHADSRWQGIDVKRGQLITGRKKLAIETGMTEQSVRTSLAKLQHTGEIAVKPTSRFTIITLCKYDTYQSGEIEINQPTNQQSTNNQPTINQRLTTNNNNNNINNDNNINKKTYCSSFDELWMRYPVRQGKKAAYKHFKSSVKADTDREDINKALDNYLSSDRVQRGFIQNGSTWFNNWRDWIDYRGEMKEETYQERQARELAETVRRLTQ